MKNTALRNALVTVGSFVVVVTVAHAWQGPSRPAPEDNVSAPLTISSISQSKVGGLDVAWLNADGGVKVGYTDATCSAEFGGTLRFNTSNNCLEYCDRTNWKCSNAEATTPPPPPTACQNMYYVYPQNNSVQCNLPYSSMGTTIECRSSNYPEDSTTITMLCGSNGTWELAGVRNY